MCRWFLDEFIKFLVRDGLRHGLWLAAKISFMFEVDICPEVGQPMNEDICSDSYLKLALYK